MKQKIDAHITKQLATNRASSVWGGGPFPAFWKAADGIRLAAPVLPPFFIGGRKGVVIFIADEELYLLLAPYTNRRRESSESLWDSKEHRFTDVD